jgi:hypothetical protein
MRVMKVLGLTNMHLRQNYGSEADEDGRDLLYAASSCSRADYTQATPA